MGRLSETTRRVLLIILALLIFLIIFVAAGTPDPVYEAAAQRPTPTDCPNDICPTDTPDPYPVVTPTPICPYPPCHIVFQELQYDYLPLIMKEK